MNAFINYLTDRHKCVEDITLGDIQQYILYLKKEKGTSPGTVNNYISAIKFFYTHVLDKAWNPNKIPFELLRNFKLHFAQVPDDGILYHGVLEKSLERMLLGVQPYPIDRFQDVIQVYLKIPLHIPPLRRCTA